MMRSCVAAEWTMSDGYTRHKNFKRWSDIIPSSAPDFVVQRGSAKESKRKMLCREFTTGLNRADVI